MCDPVSLMIGSMAVSAVGTGFSAMTSLQSGKIQQQQYEHQAQLREQKAAYDTRLLETKYARQAGEVQSRIAGSGVSLTSFSDVLADSAMEFALERKAIKYGADREAENLRTQGKTAKYNAKAEAIGTVISGFGNMLGGSAKVSQARGVSVSSPWETTVHYGS